MAATSFFGHALLGLGPGAAFFLAVLAPSSLLVLLSLLSAFLWLLVMLVTAALLRGAAPLPQSAPVYAGALLAAVVLEEVARLGVVRLHLHTVAILSRMSRSSGHAFTPLDELRLSVAWGFGQAATHSLMSFGSLLPLTAGHGTIYNSSCPEMSVFLAAALNSLGMGATLVALSVVALDAWAHGQLWGKVYAPAAHAAAALLTLGSMQLGGCVPVAAVQVAFGLVNACYAFRVAWQRTRSSQSTTSAVAAWSDDAGAVLAPLRGSQARTPSADGGALPPPPPSTAAPTAAAASSEAAALLVSPCNVGAGSASKGSLRSRSGNQQGLGAL